MIHRLNEVILGIKTGDATQEGKTGKREIAILLLLIWCVLFTLRFLIGTDLIGIEASGANSSGFINFLESTTENLFWLCAIAICGAFGFEGLSQFLIKKDSKTTGEDQK